MGLDATVSCNCFREGRTTEPPIPRDWLYLDEEGDWSCRPEHEAEYCWSELYEWKQRCCEHEGMDYASEHISNWAGYRLFQEALAKVGAGNFPTLLRELPSTNDGITLPESARQALQEIERFRQAREIGKNAVLVDTSTGFEIFEHVAAYDGIFIFGGRSGMQAGIGESAFFIRERESGRVLFQGTRIRQKLLDPIPEGSNYDGRVEFQDLVTHQTLVCSIVISGRPTPWPDGRIQNDTGAMRFSPSDGFHVEVRTTVPADFNCVLDSLSKVFEASLATGNPVRWC